MKAWPPSLSAFSIPVWTPHVEVERRKVGPDDLDQTRQKRDVGHSLGIALLLRPASIAVWLPHLHRCDNIVSQEVVT